MKYTQYSVHAQDQPRECLHLTLNSQDYYLLPGRFEQNVNFFEIQYFCLYI